MDRHRGSAEYNRDVDRNIIECRQRGLAALGMQIPNDDVSPWHGYGVVNERQENGLPPMLRLVTEAPAPLTRTESQRPATQGLKFLSSTRLFDHRRRLASVWGIPPFVRCPVRPPHRNFRRDMDCAATQYGAS